MSKSFLYQACFHFLKKLMLTDLTLRPIQPQFGVGG